MRMAGNKALSFLKKKILFSNENKNGIRIEKKFISR